MEDAYDRRLAPGSLRAPPRALAPTVGEKHGPSAIRYCEVVAASRVWLLPEPWPEPKSDLEVTRCPYMKPYTYPCQPALGEAQQAELKGAVQELPGTAASAWPTGTGRQSISGNGSALA